MKRFVCLWFAISLGCSGPENVTEFISQKVIVTCDRLIECGAIGRSERDRCETDGTTLLSGVSPGFDYSPLIEEKAGRIALDRGQANDCVNALRGASCPELELTAVSLECLRAFHGRVPTGGICFFTGDCESGECPGATSTCPGKCTPYQNEGAACGHGFDCDPASDVCDGTRCVPSFSEGSACTSPQECAAGLHCYDGHCRRLEEGWCGENRCGDDEVCHSDQRGGNSTPMSPPSLPTCVKLPKTGEPCPDFFCEKGDVCAGPPSPPDGGARCAAVLDLGSACDPQANACPLENVCDASTRICVSRDARAGDNCSLNDCDGSLGFSLEPPLTCDTASKTCVRVRINGQTCVAGDHCPERCDLNAGVCVSDLHCL